MIEPEDSIDGITRKVRDHAKQLAIMAGCEPFSELWYQAIDYFGQSIIWASYAKHEGFIKLAKPVPKEDYFEEVFKYYYSMVKKDD